METAQVDNPTEPLAPPYPIGTSLQYHGGRWGRGRPGIRPTSDDDYLWVNDGDIGAVVRIEEGSVGRPDIGPEFAEPIHGWSVVEFPSGATAALSGDDERHVERYRVVA